MPTPAGEFHKTEILNRVTVWASPGYVVKNPYSDLDPDKRELIWIPQYILQQYQNEVGQMLFRTSGVGIFSEEAFRYPKESFGRGRNIVLVSGSINKYSSS